MEFLDIVDENNNLTGEIEERNYVHELGLWHRHSSCWIMNNNGEILLQKRASTKKRNPSKWSKTGGHVETGETPIKALKREVLEEIGIKLRDDQIEFIKEFKNNTESNKSFNYNYFVRVNYRIEEYIIQKEELSEVRYFTIEEIEQTKLENDQSFAFTNWPDNDFYKEIEYLKRKREEIKELIKNLRKVNSDIDNSIFRSMNNINLDCVLGTKKNGEYKGFLDEYDENKQNILE